MIKIENLGNRELTGSNDSSHRFYWRIHSVVNRSLDLSTVATADKNDKARLEGYVAHVLSTLPPKFSYTTAGDGRLEFPDTYEYLRSISRACTPKIILHLTNETFTVIQLKEPNSLLD